MKEAEEREEEEAREQDFKYFIKIGLEQDEAEQAKEMLNLDDILSRETSPWQKRR